MEEGPEDGEERSKKRSVPGAERHDRPDVRSREEDLRGRMGERKESLEDSILQRLSARDYLRLLEALRASKIRHVLLLENLRYFLAMKM